MKSLCALPRWIDNSLLAPENKHNGPQQHIFAHSDRQSVNTLSSKLNR
jgi:hypothetical protein